MQTVLFWKWSISYFLKQNEQKFEMWFSIRTCVYYFVCFFKGGSLSTMRIFGWHFMHGVSDRSMCSAPRVHEWQTGILLANHLGEYCPNESVKHWSCEFKVNATYLFIVVFSVPDFSCCNLLSFILGCMSCV